MSARTEGRYIKKSPDSRTRFKDLAQGYLDLPEVKAKRSYNKDLWHTKRLIACFGDRLLKDINPALVEAYKQKRLSENSHRGKLCIRGMRVTVGTIVGLIASGKTVDKVLADYPYLTREDLLEALSYAPSGPENGKCQRQARKNEIQR